MLNLIKKKPTGGKPVKQNTKNKNKTLKLLYLYKKIKNVLADKFVKDPREVVKAGDVIKVRVLEVDLQRKRIALTRRLSDPVDTSNANASGKNEPRAGSSGKFSPPAKKPRENSNQPAPNNALAAAFAKAKQS